jgi:hypothetical protein
MMGLNGSRVSASQCWCRGTGIVLVGSLVLGLTLTWADAFFGCPCIDSSAELEVPIWHRPSDGVTYRSLSQRLFAVLSVVWWCVPSHLLPQ